MIVICGIKYFKIAHHPLGIFGAQLALGRMAAEFEATGYASSNEAAAEALRRIRAEAKQGTAGLDASLRIALKPEVLQESQDRPSRYAAAAAIV
ncbi:hypothetical protein [Methylorubrum zatmanii]|uniref:Uncharacterized protein n=1 Tax=Methylorubrum zatmanii TaxID=29429 RepID=A0ABW1WWH9_9HYPH|nr:hypothetical protein [Methylorubrum zatmanii]